MLKSHGFNTLPQKQPSGHSLIWAPIYGDGYAGPSNICCTIEMTRRAVEITFYELDQGRHSGVFTSTEKQRVAVVALRTEIVDSIHRSLPGVVKVDEAEGRCPANTHMHWTRR
jgi:hypothetical protein